MAFKRSAVRSRLSPPKIEACVITQVSIFISSKIYYGGLYQPDGILQKAPPAAARQMKLLQGRDFPSEESRPFFIFSKRSGEHDF